MSEQQPERPQTNNRPMVGAAVLVIVALIAMVLWQSGGQDQRSAPAEQAAAPATEEASADSALDESDQATDLPAENTDEAAEDTAVEPTEAPVDTATSSPSETPEPTEPPEPTETPTPEPPRQVSDLPAVAYEELPPEAHDTIELIDEGGPFPYDKDGSTFQNREGILPDREMGYYSEYTVITPGSPDRGARRIVAGADGELYYTDDHYASFEEVLR